MASAIKFWIAKASVSLCGHLFCQKYLDKCNNTLNPIQDRDGQGMGESMVTVRHIDYRYKQKREWRYTEYRVAQWR